MWLSTGVERDKKKHAEARRSARRQVRAAKDAWFQRKAMEAERGRHGGKLVWCCIRDIQRGRRGLVPVRTATVRDEEGNVCDSPEEQQQRWRRHFTKILNIQSEFSAEELERVRQRPVRQDMEELPSEEELLRAVGKLKNGKAGGESGILPEMVKAACCEPDFLDKWLSWYRMCGGKVQCQATGVMPSLFPSQRRVTSVAVTTGEGSPFWMWSGRWLLVCFRRGCRSWLGMSHSEGSGRRGAVLT